MRFQVFFKSSAAAGGGSGAEPPAERREDAPASTTYDPVRAASSMIREARGNVKAVVAHLLRESKRYRDRIRTQELELQKRPALADGAIVLQPDEAKKWNAIKALSIDPEKLPERLKAADELESEKLVRQRQDKMREASTKLGHKRPGLLVDQLTQRQQEVIDREVEVEDREGKRTKKQVPHVRKVGAKDTDPTRPLEEFVNTELKDYHELLMTEPNESRSAEDSSPVGERTIPAQVGVRGRAPKSDPVERHVQDRYMSPAEFQQRQTKQGA